MKRITWILLILLAGCKAATAPTPPVAPPVIPPAPPITLNAAYPTQVFWDHSGEYVIWICQANTAAGTPWNGVDYTCVPQPN